MKIFAISDLHLAISVEKPMDIFGGAWENYMDVIKKNWKKKVTENDLVLIAGDVSWAMKFEDFKKDLHYFDDLPGIKVIIRGNHDYWWKSISLVRNSLGKNFFALQNDAIKIENIIICGTRGWSLPEKTTSEEDKKIFLREVNRLELALKNAQSLRNNNEKVIVLIHFPPYLPKNKDNEFMRLFIKYKVDIVVFGHIHFDRIGFALKEKIGEQTFYLTSCDILKNDLAEIDINEK